MMLYKIIFIITLVLLACHHNASGLLPADVWESIMASDNPLAAIEKLFLETYRLVATSLC